MKVHKTTSELQEIIEGYKTLIETQRQEIFELKKIASENEKHINLMQGYKNVIETLSMKLLKKNK